MLSRMRFLFVLREGLLRVFEGPIQSLCEGGDEVLAIVEAQRRHTHHLVDRLKSRAPGIEIRFIEAELRERPEVELDTALRVWIDYLHYLEPELLPAERYREQRGRALPESLREATDRVSSESPEVRTALVAGLRALERTLEVPPEVTGLLERERPDAVVVSPLMTHSSQQVLYLRAARRLGIPTALCVASWDNLPSKGLIHEVPDLVSVWNDAQRDDAVRLHGVPPDRIAVTGAPRFDEWFGRSPTTSREEYCERLELPPDRPHILYVGSTTFKRSLHEGEWISRWVSRVRKSGHPELEDVPVVVRPHPKRSLAGDSKGARELASTPGVVVHPPDGAFPDDDEALSEYFDSLHHAAVVVGINTSALVEAAVVGRGVHVPLARPYRSIQQDCPHFQHLLSVGGGLIVVSKSLERHAEGLARALRGDDSDEANERARAFVASFVRPQGIDRPATPIMVESLRALAARKEIPTDPEMNGLADGLRSMLLPQRPKRAARRNRGEEPVESPQGTKARREGKRRRDRPGRTGDKSRTRSRSGKRRRAG
jgi:hypothetical protein